MKHDKKNDTADHINFTMLDTPGRPVIDCTASDDVIKESLDIFCDLLG